MVSKIYRFTSVVSEKKAKGVKIHDVIPLSYEERHVRRKVLPMANGNTLIFDFIQTVQLSEGDLLMSESGEFFRVKALDESLYEVRGKNSVHLLELAWHCGNRHLAIEICLDCLRVFRDPVIGATLKKLDADVQEITDSFHPFHGGSHVHR
ncbi:MAG: urease accessory protein [Candidatus Tokpelaia sp. JSC161]|jgi:urease accessory protein|nr:MAG: urease accessory protein [Candidatus Tokpelaia sp. JSC161]